MSWLMILFLLSIASSMGGAFTCHDHDENDELGF